MPHDSPLEVVLMVASFAVLVTGCVLVVRRDERRLDEERLERAWPEPSRDSALIGLGLLLSPLAALIAVVFHFFRTRSDAMWPPWRWSIKGLALGIAWASAILIVDLVVITAIAALFGVPME